MGEEGSGLNQNVLQCIKNRRSRRCCLLSLPHELRLSSQACFLLFTLFPARSRPGTAEDSHFELELCLH